MCTTATRLAVRVRGTMPRIWHLHVAAHAASSEEQRAQLSMAFRGALSCALAMPDSPGPNDGCDPATAANKWPAKPQPRREIHWPQRAGAAMHMRAHTVVAVSATELAR